jgi:hypothetical protein
LGWFPGKITNDEAVIWECTQRINPELLKAQNTEKFIPIQSLLKYEQSK